MIQGRRASVFARGEVGGLHTHPDSMFSHVER